MNKQTIEEIEILVSARCEEAKKEIKKMADTVSKEMKKAETSMDVEKIKRYREEMSKVAREWNKGKDVVNHASVKKSSTTTKANEPKYDLVKNTDVSSGDSGKKVVDHTSKLSGLKNVLQQVKQEATTCFANMKQGLQSLKEETKSTIAQQEQLRKEIELLEKSLKEDATAPKSVKMTKDEVLKYKVELEKAKNKLIDLQAQEQKNTKNNGFIAKLKEKLKSVGIEFNKAKKKGNTFGKEIGKSFSNGIKSIKKFALSLLSVRSAFSVVSKAMSSYLSFDTQLSDSIQNCWNALGSLLAPALEYVVSLFSKLVSVTATFVKALTGVDLVARANAKALNNQAKATKNATKSLSGIDDIDTLSSSSGGDDTQKITVEDMDIKPLEKFLKEAKKILSKVFDPFKQAWENVGTGVFESMQSMVSSIGELGSSVMGSAMEVWTNGTGQTIIENALLGFQQLIDIVSNLGEALKLAWDNNNNGTNTLQHIAGIFTNIQTFVLSIGDSLKKWTMSESFQKALTTVFDVTEDIFGIAKDIGDWLLEMYDKYIKPVIDDKLLPAINEIIIAIGDIWKVCEPVVKWIIEIIKNRLEPVIDGLTGIIGGVIDIIKGIAKFVSGVFTLDWEKAWNGIKDIFGGIWDIMSSIISTPINLILSGVETLVNACIKGFNKVKEGINKIKFDVPDWVPVIGGQKWGFDLKETKEVTLPRLATGTVAYETTPAVIGEYANARSNPEIVSPVSMMKDSFRSVLNEFDFGGTRVDTLRIDVAGENFYQGTVDYINTENSRKGVNIIKEV